VEPGFSAKEAADQRPSILIDAAHHARELTSVSQVFYTMIRFLHGYLNNDEQVRKVLATSGLYFVPLVNYDGYAKISSVYVSDGYLAMIRKNQRPDSNYNCGFDEIGVDLNRNYGFQWGIDD
jgi:murein tripeptide amidase MpaA